MSRWERAAIVLTPLAAVTTMAIGLRVGAAPPVRAAVVFGAPPAANRQGLAWQLLTLVDDRGVREAVPLAGLSVVARAQGKEARWEGATDADGVAEVWLGLPGVGSGDRVTLDVRAEGEKASLASGDVTWPAEVTREVSRAPAFVRASKQDGDLLVEVAVYGGRLAPGGDSSVWVHVRDRASGAAASGVTIKADPEPGLSIASTQATTDAAGWAELGAVAEIHVVALGLRAETNGPGAPKHGAWYGALPVAPGAAFVHVPPTWPAGAPITFDIVVPTVAPRVYVEVDDEVGRAFAAVAEVERADTGGHARVHADGLPPGTAWLVTAGDPHGAERLEGSAIARPFLVTKPGVGAAAGGAPADPDLVAKLATLAPPRFARFVALDGLPGRRRADLGRHRRGLALAFGSLVIAAALEALLILRGVERARRDLARMSDMLDDRPSVERRFRGASVIIGLLVALLGFALLAALLTWKAG